MECRLTHYHRKLEMADAHYPKTNLWTIDGTKPIAEVSDTIKSILMDEIPKRR